VKTVLEGLLEAQEHLDGRLETCCDALEDRLKRCIRRRKAELIHRIAELARLGIEKGVFTPKRLVAETGMKYSVVYRDLQRLRHLGIAVRMRWGLYAVKPGVPEKDLEEEIARAMVVQLVGNRPGK
jgi:hypothetical protein